MLAEKPVHRGHELEAVVAQLKLACQFGRRLERRALEQVVGGTTVVVAQSVGGPRGGEGRGGRARHVVGAVERAVDSGALRKAVDAGLVDMNDLVQIWQSKPIPEGPVVLRTTLPADVKVKMATLMASLPSIDPDCAYGVLQGDAKGFMPIGHDAYEVIIEARKLKAK